MKTALFYKYDLKDARMEIVYDNIIFALQQYGGISVVWSELLKRQQEDGTLDIKYLDVTHTDNYARKRLPIPDERIIGNISSPVISRYLPVRISCDKPFLFHSSYYRYCSHAKAINITTVHDFTYELFYSGMKKAVHSWQKSKAIRHSDCIVCISESTKRDLLRFLPDVDESKVSVVYNGVSDEFRILNEHDGDAMLPYPSQTFVVFIGKREPYKNFHLVLKGVSKTGLNLLIVGKPLSPQEQHEIEQLIPKEKYLCLGHVNDKELNRLYNHAKALVYPSSYEGFGLPVLEAQKAGCPVIAYAASSIPEVIGSTPMLMKELTVTELVTKLRLLDNKQLMTEVRNAGLANSQAFSWEKTHQSYLKLYQEAYRRKVSKISQFIRF